MVPMYINRVRHSILHVTSGYLRAGLYIPCIGQKVDQRSCNSHYHHQRSFNSHYHHKAAPTNHPRLLSDMPIWSSGMQAVCVIGQLPGIQVPHLFGRATSDKSKFDQ